MASIAYTYASMRVQRKPSQPSCAAAKALMCLHMPADLMQVLIWLTPAGTVDDGGKEQPAYLNFDVSLLGPPSGNHMEVSRYLSSILRSILFCVHIGQHEPQCLCGVSTPHRVMRWGNRSC